MSKANIKTGNAATDSKETRGWFVGHFIDESLGLCHSDDVEIKWGVHKAGEERGEWMTGETRTALCILISGKFVAEFRDKTVTLEKPGDYVMWGKDVDHQWRVPEDTVTVTVRWPSVPTN